MISNILSSSQFSILQAVRNTSDSIGRVQSELASGKKIQSALDSPQNYFASKALFYQADDLNKILDGISQSIRTVQEANIGVETILKLIDQAEFLVEDGLTTLFPRTDETPDAEAMAYILSKNPDKAYFASTNNFYQNTTDFTTWHNASARAAAAGLNGVPEITGHLATITSQEENDVIHGLLTATSWLGGSDSEVEGEWRWVEGPEAGEQFWQGLSGGSATNGAYTNWGGGEPNQFLGTPENYLHMRADGRWNDLPTTENLNYIIEWGGDLLVLNPDVNVSKEAMDYRRTYLALINQIEEIAVDANYRGVKLLKDDDLKTTFNRDSKSSLKTDGMDVTLEGLGLTNDNFVSKIEMTSILKDLRDARKVLRQFGSTLQSDLSIMTARREFSENAQNTFRAGGTDLIIADMNEKGSEMLALQTRQQLQIQSLSLSLNSNILDLFS